MLWPVRACYDPGVTDLQNQPAETGSSTPWAGVRIDAVADSIEPVKGEALRLAASFDSAFVGLSPNYLSYQQLTDSIGWVVIWVLALGATGLGLGIGWGGVWWWGPTGVIGLPVLAMWSMFWYQPRAIAQRGYALTDRVLAMKSGLWWKSVRLLPVSRLQHVNYESGPIQSRFDLATLVAHTAGSSESSIEISGLSRASANRLRDELLKQADELRQADVSSRITNEGEPT